ncbi:MAG: 6-phosphofructokinase, partial [Fervidobacterium sp.]
ALGWINGIGADIVLLPERPFDKDEFIQEVDKIITQKGYCAIAVAEGIKYPDGFFVSDMGFTDSFGNRQLGGVGFTIAGMVRSELGLKTHVAIPDYLQRSGRHIASARDLEEAEMCGRMAVRFALEDNYGVMVTMERLSDEPYEIKYNSVTLNLVADQTRMLPKEYYTSFSVTEKFYKYALPLIEGEIHPPFKNGLPNYGLLKLV